MYCIGNTVICMLLWTIEGNLHHQHFLHEGVLWGGGGEGGGRVEWYSTFCDFLKRALRCRSRIFLWVQLKKNPANLVARAAHSRQSFHFPKIAGTLTMNIFWNLCKYLPFTSKNNPQKKNDKLNGFWISFRPQNGQNLILTWSNEMQFYLRFS